MLKKVLAIIIMVIIVNVRCFANNSLEQIYDNVVRFTTRICHGWNNLDENFKNLEQNLRLLNGDITKDDVDDLKQICEKHFTSHDDRRMVKTATKKLNALTDAMDNYIDKRDSCCCQTAANGKTLMKLYYKNLKKYN